MLVGLYRVAGSLLVLRWPFWGGVAAVICDLGDLLLFNLFVAYGGWPGFDGYQAFDKWVDQVYLAAFLIVALRDFARPAGWNRHRAVHRLDRTPPASGEPRASALVRCEGVPARG